MSAQFSILIGNRSRFEAGDANGHWLDMPATKEQLQVAMQNVGITADNPQDFSIRGYSDDPDNHIALPYEMVCAADLDELNFLAARLHQITPAEIGELNAAAQRQNGFENIGQIIDFTYNVDYFVHIPEVHTPRDLGDYYLNKSGMVDMPEEWKGGIDLAAFGKYVAEQEKGAFTEYGYIVESGDEWERHFEGRDVPEEYRIMSYPQPEQNIDFEAIAPTQTAELRPVTPIILSSESTDDKMKEITDRLEQGIAGIFESERYAEYLRTVSKFHEYSFNNTLLIAMQGGSMVKGYRQWEKEFDRHVKQGEKAIKIIAPAPYKVKKLENVLDPETKQPVLDKNGQPVTEEKEITIPNYKVVSVFDVSQTEGKPLPELGASELLGDVKNYEDFFAALKRTSPFEVSLEPLEAGVNGRCLYDERRIQIDDKMSELQTIKTTVHEIAHATLHDINRDAPDRPDRSTREVQAESVAYTVCQYYGLDTSDYSFGYIAEWHSGRELAELKSSLETVRSTAATLIETIDGHFAEIQKAREEQKQIQASLDPAIQPVVTVVWSESNELQDGIKLPLFRANEIFRSLDADKYTEFGGRLYDKTRFEIDYTLNGEAGHYEGQQDFGDGDGSLIEHIEKFHTGYIQNEEYKNRLLQNDGQEAMEQTIAGHEQVVNEIVPYLKLHDSLSQMEQAAGQAMREANNLTPAQTAYYEALQQYVDDCQAMLNQGNYSLPAAPRLSDFDPELQEYKQHVMDEITQEAASAGMTVEEYAANGYEPRTPAPETPVFDTLPPEQQQALSDTVKDTLQILVDADMAAHGEVTDGTLEAIAVQGYSYRDGQLEKQTDEPQPTEAPQPATPYYTINESAALRAKMMNSFDDYRPGSATAEYRHYVDEAVQLAERQKARVDPMYHDKIDSLLDTYARKLAANMNASYSIEARVPSIMISGGGNFPVRQKEKQNAARDRNMQEWQYIQGLLDKIRSTGMGGISADDPQAVQKLEKKLESLTKAQENMKAINAYYRKHKSLDGCPLVSPEQAQRLISGMEHYDRAPYPAWALSNNSAEIRRLKNRIADLSKKQEIGYIGWEFEGGKVEVNTTDNRLQIFFEEKPDAAIREELKGNGFRWSPRAEAWQRQLNDNAYYAANHIKAIQPLTGEQPTELLRAHIRQQKAALQKKPAPDMDMPPQPEPPMPDPSISLKNMQDYGYSWDGMLPLRRATAEKLFSQDMGIFCIYEDGTERAVSNLDDLRQHAEKGGIFGVNKEDWNAYCEYATMKQELQENEPSKEALLLYGKDDSFGIYQLKQGNETRDLRFEPYDRLQAAGHAVDPANYALIYTASLTPGTSLEDIFTRFNIDHPEDFTGHSLSVSDVVVLHQNGKTTAHYVDSVGYRQVPEFLQEQQKALVPDEHTTGETIRTLRGTFYLTDMTPDQMKAAGYGVHHTSEDGQYLIMTDNTRAFAVAAQPERENPLKHVEDIIEQNDNSFDGIINNTPTVDELEQKAMAGEQISLVDLANAIKADKEAQPEKKPSILAQLKADKEKAAPKKEAATSKNHDLEV